MFFKKIRNLQGSVLLLYISFALHLCPWSLLPVRETPGLIGPLLILFDRQLVTAAAVQPITLGDAGHYLGV